jgi:hypothetical protein
VKVKFCVENVFLCLVTRSKSNPGYKDVRSGPDLIKCAMIAL